MPTRADLTTRRLTLNLSGAVSLGAYEGGVVSQIAYALARWNELAPEKAPLAVIDVIAGASAGSMTGAMLAYHLVKGTDPRRFVDQVRESWCGEGTVLKNMVQMDPADQHSFLSSRRIDEVAERLFQEEPVHLERVRQDEVIFTCTLTALDAIPYEFKMLTRKGLADMEGWTRQDWVTFSLRPDEQAPVVELPTGRKRVSGVGRPVDWKRLVSFGVASGAFPVAFQPMQISRANSDYPRPLREREGWTRMRYTDGGLLDNMPFKRASDALSSLEGRSPAEHRLHILIEVQPFRYSLGESQADGEFQEAVRDPSPVAAVLGSSFEALRQQSLYSDLSQSQDVNRRLSWRDRFLFPALAAAANAVGDVAAARAAAIRELDEFLGEKWSGDGRLSAEAELEHYRQLAALPDTRLHQALDQVHADPAERRDLFLLQVALVDNVTGLRDKCPIRVERIAPPDPTRLAGEGLGAFGGFLDQDLTRHDFLCGLRDAYRWLKGWAADEGWPEPAPVDWYPREPRGDWLTEQEVGQFPRSILEPASDQVISRILNFWERSFQLSTSRTRMLLGRSLWRSYTLGCGPEQTK